MSKYCSDCTYLNTSQKKGEGCYQCDKTGKKVFGNQEWCTDFETAYARSSSEKNKIYDDGKEAQKKAESSGGLSGLLAALMVLLLIICKVFGLI